MRDTNGGLDVNGGKRGMNDYGPMNLKLQLRMVLSPRKGHLMERKRGPEVVRMPLCI